MANKLIVAPAPHVQTAQSTTRIMRDVVIALMPALVVSTVVFGLDVLRVTALSVVSCVVIEYLIQKFMVRGATTVGNWSAVVTGVLLAFNLPASIPWWIVVMGAAAALLCGFVYLLWRRVITWHIPVTVLATMAVFAGVVAMCSVSFDALPQAADGTCSAGYKLGYLFGTAWRAGIFHVLAGGAMLGAIFMATDYSTSPMTVRGGVIFAVGIGLITMCIRLWGAYPEGMSFAILIMNACVPLINKYVKPKRFGVK